MRAIASLARAIFRCWGKRPESEKKHGRIYRASEKGFDWMLKVYRGSLGWVLRHQALTLLVTILTAGLSVYLYVIAPKGFFPQQDTGRLGGAIQASSDAGGKAAIRSAFLNSLVRVGLSSA